MLLYPFYALKLTNIKLRRHKFFRVIYKITGFACIHENLSDKVRCIKIMITMYNLYYVIVYSTFVYFGYFHHVFYDLILGFAINYVFYEFSFALVKIFIFAFTVVIFTITMLVTGNIKDFKNSKYWQNEAFI